MAFFHFTAPESAAGTRLDKYLSFELPQYSREFLKKCQVRVNSAPAKLAHKVQAGEEVELRVPALKTLTIEAEDLPLAVVYEDPHLLVLNKPAGQVVHPTDHGGHVTGTVVNAVLHHCGVLPGSETRPGIVHRLDRDTSGLLVVAKTELAKTHLTQQFADRKVDKEYLALVLDNLKTPAGRIEAPIGRGSADRTRRAISTAEDAREAVTEFAVLEHFGRASLLSVRILTGRTHQIRVHLASIGHPVVGDSTYGHAKANAEFGIARQALHAAKLSFTHPATGERVEYEAPLPADFENELVRLRKSRLIKKPPNT